MADQCLWPSASALANRGTVLLKGAIATQAGLGFEAANTMRALLVHGLDDHAIAYPVAGIVIIGTMDLCAQAAPNDFDLGCHSFWLSGYLHDEEAERGDRQWSSEARGKPSRSVAEPPAESALVPLFWDTKSVCSDARGIKAFSVSINWVETTTPPQMLKVQRLRLGRLPGMQRRTNHFRPIRAILADSGQTRVSRCLPP